MKHPFVLPVCFVLVSCASSVQSPPQSPPTTTSSEVPKPLQPGERGDIVGTITTNPWRAIKGGAVVYLEDAPKQPGVLSGTLDNHDMTFMPSIVAISAGGSVIFTNTDPVNHNVFTPDGDKWNLGEIPQFGSVVKKFDTAGTYTVLCNLHPMMLAYLVVAPSTFVAKADESGAFVIKNVPPGTYKVTAWAPRMKSVTQTITVAARESKANFALER